MSTRRTAGVFTLLAVLAAVILISLVVWVLARTIRSPVVSASPTIGRVPEAVKTYYSRCNVADATDAANPYSAQHRGQFEAVRDQVLPHCIGQADDLGDVDSQTVIMVNVLPNGDALGKSTGGTATDQQMDEVRNYLSAQGVAVSPPAQSIISFVATASLGAFERALHVPIHAYRFKPGAVIATAGNTYGGPDAVSNPERITFYAPEYDPLLPAATGKFVYMIGLNDAPVDNGVHSSQPGY